MIRTTLARDEGERKGNDLLNHYVMTFAFRRASADSRQTNTKALKLIPGFRNATNGGERLNHG